VVELSLEWAGEESDSLLLAEDSDVSGLLDEGVSVCGFDETGSAASALGLPSVAEEGGI